MYYVVSKYRILVESETSVQMKDYPNCELIEGPQGVSLINFEVYEEDGKRKVRTKKKGDIFDISITIPSLEKKGGTYEMEAGGKEIDIKIESIGTPYLPPLFKFPENYKHDNKIDIVCSRGKLSSNYVIKSGIVKWTPVDETIECSIIISALNFPPIQKYIKIKLI